MKAAVLHQPSRLDSIEIVDLPDPGLPGPGEIRVRIHASSLNWHDYAVVSGLVPTADRRIPMSDGAGVVEAVGEGVTEFTVGDHVVSCFFPLWQDGPAAVADFLHVPGDGIDGYAREVVVKPATWFTRVPRGYGDAEAATLTTAGLTAWRALVVDGGLKAGDTVLALGTGGVSIFALQIAKAMGARVIVTSSSEEKLARATAHGADAVINYRAHPEWQDAVLALTDGRGVDHVVEVGGVGTLPRSIRACRIGGHIALIGVLTGFEGPVPTLELLTRQQRVQGLIVGSRREQQEFVRAIEATGIRPVIDASFTLEGLGEAFRLQERGGHFGKIVVEF